MTTEAQRARNARKRAKLKAHRKAEKKYTVAPWDVTRYVVSCRETELWYSWKHTEIISARTYPDMTACPDHVRMAWVDEVLSKFAPGQSKIVPGSFQVSMQCKLAKDTVWDDLTAFCEVDLAAELNRRAVELQLVA